MFKFSAPDYENDLNNHGHVWMNPSWDSQRVAGMPNTETIYGQFYDMMTFYIGTRAFAIGVLGLFAMKKCGEQLRFMIAFWMIIMLVAFQDMFGAFCYYETTDPGDGKKWMQFIMGFITLAISTINIMMIHKQVEGRPVQAGMQQVKQMADGMGINMGGMQMVNKV